MFPARLKSQSDNACDKDTQMSELDIGRLRRRLDQTFSQREQLDPACHLPLPQA
jgi:hypothetical protein